MEAGCVNTGVVLNTCCTHVQRSKTQRKGRPGFISWGQGVGPSETTAKKRVGLSFYVGTYLVGGGVTLGGGGEFAHGEYHGRRNFKDTNPLMSSLPVTLFGVEVLNLVRNIV